MTFTDSEVIIGIVNFIGDALGKIGELLSNPLFTGTAIAAIAIHMAKVIGLKLQEQHIARETEKIERKRALMESQQKLEQLKLARKQLEAGVSEIHNNAENLKLQLKLTKEARKRLNLQRAENGEITKEEADRLNKALDDEYDNEIKRIDEQTQKHIDSQKEILDAQIKTQSEIVKMNEDQMNSIQGLRSA